MSNVYLKSEENDVVIISICGAINAYNSDEYKKDINEIRSNYPQGKLVFDMENLEYVSSAGLRVLLATLKNEKEKVCAVNVDKTVYEIFEVTGFVELLDISRKKRKISISACEMIGKGANGEVYRLDNETIIKVYQPMTPMEDVQRERDLAQKAFIKGIPTAISYDVVEVDDGLGIVFEMLNAKSLSEVVEQKPDEFNELAKKYVEVYKTIHSTHVRNEDFPKAKDIYNGYIDGCVEWYIDEEIKKLKKLVNSIPDTDTLIHGDYHARNIMYVDGELLMIDMGDVSIGHPMFDFIATAATQANLVDLNPKFAVEHTRMSIENIKKMWDGLLRMYFSDKSEDEILALDKKIRIMSKLKVALAPVVGRGLPLELIQGSVDDAKINLIPYIDDLLEGISW